MAFVIGIGGTGKWVVHQLRKQFMEKEKGEIPQGCKLLNMDIFEDDTPNPYAEWYEQGKRVVFEFNSDVVNQDFLLLENPWNTTLRGIQKGKGKEYGNIYAWLKEDDANCYGVSGQADVQTGAAAMRQISRHAVFSSAQNIIDNIRDHPGGRTYIVSSIAGGTGCGAALDVAILLRHTFRQAGDRGSEVIGVFILPQAFDTAVQETHSRNIMRANCLAFLRELFRLCREGYGKIQYAPGIWVTGSGSVPIFNGLILADASRYGGRLEEGLAQSLADWLYRDILGGPLTQHANWFVNYSRNIKTGVDPMGSWIATAVGTYRIRWEGERVAEAILLRLAEVTFYGFVAEEKDSGWAERATLDGFLSRDTSLPFDRNFVRGILDKRIALNRLILNERGVLQPICMTGSPQLDEVKFKEGDIIALHDKGELKLNSPKSKKRDELLKKYVRPAIGNPGDPLPNKLNDVPLLPALEYYLKLNAEHFCDNLDDFLSDLLTLEDIAAKGSGPSHGMKGLGRCVQALEKLANHYEECLQRLDNAISSADYRKEKKNKEAEAKDFYENRYMKKIKLPGTYREWLEKERNWIRLERFLLYVDHFINPLLEFRRDTCRAYLEEIADWRRTFEASIDYLRGCQGKLNAVRASDHNKLCWRFVTKHPELDVWDEAEEFLFKAATKEVKSSAEGTEKGIIDAIQASCKCSWEELGDMFKWKIGHREVKFERIPFGTDTILKPGTAIPQVTCDLRYKGKELTLTRYAAERTINMQSYGLVEALREATGICEDGGVKSLNIFSLLELKGENEDGLLKEILNVGVNAGYDAGKRAKTFTDANQNTVNQSLEEKLVFLPRVSPTTVGHEIGNDLNRKLRNRNFEVQETDDQSEILVLLEEHLIMPQAFAGVQSCEKPYAEVASGMADYYLKFYRGSHASFDPSLQPLHLFLAEKNAIILERLIGIRDKAKSGMAEHLPTALVSLFDRPWEELKKELLRFSWLCFGLSKIRTEKEDDGRNYYCLFYDPGDGERKVILGQSLTDALASFLEPDFIPGNGKVDRAGVIVAREEVEKDKEVSDYKNRLRDDEELVKESGNIVREIDSVLKNPKLMSLFEDIDKTVLELLQLIMEEEGKEADIRRISKSITTPAS